MSFRNKKNAHDKWVAYRDKKSESFGLFADDVDSINQQSFEEYLTEGTNTHFHTPLMKLSDENFLILEKIVNDWESFDYGFDSFYSERVKRFNSYG